MGPVLRPLLAAEALGHSSSPALKSSEGFGQGERTAQVIVELGPPAETQSGLF